MSQRPDRTISSTPIVALTNVSKEYRTRSVSDRLMRREGHLATALDSVTMTVDRGEAVAIVGESGSGKTTLARSLVGLVKPDTGSVEIGGRDLAGVSRGELAQVRRSVQMIYQDPYSSLNSALTVGQAIIEPALVHGLVDRAEAPGRLEELMGQVGLGIGIADRKPEGLSGGQRQRVAIARSLAAEPEVLVADEAVSALDVSIQRQVLALFARLREELGLTLVFISHQLATVAQLCNRVAIMYRGRVVEAGPVREIFSEPRHGYTAALMKAHPGGKRLRERSPASVIEERRERVECACPFVDRCDYRREICAEVDPGEAWMTQEHMSRCHVLPYDADLAAGAGVLRRATQRRGRLRDSG